MCTPDAYSQFDRNGHDDHNPAQSTLDLHLDLRSTLGQCSFADATTVVRKNDSGAALQRIRRSLVQVRDGTHVFENFVTHDKFWIGRG